MVPCFSEGRIVPRQSPSLLPSTDSNIGQVTSPPGVSISMNSPSDYTVYQAIGVGCFGTASIFISQHTPTGVFTVLRVFDLEILSTGDLQDVEKEMKLSQLLYHSNIANYTCSFVVGTKLWAIQPLMHYGSCADIMHSAQPFRGGFQESIISLILKDVVSGLDYLHSVGLVHRSIRAKHFLIHEDGTVKLSGLRSVVSMIEGGARVKALHGHYAGTVDNICWLAPEILSQDLSGYSFQSDVYSVGIAALELATGEAPFAGLPVTEIMMLKLRGHPPVLMKKGDGERESHISNHLSKIIDLCVDSDPAGRPSPTKLLNTSFLKVRKRPSMNSLKELLLPVVPLDTSKLKVSESGMDDLLQTISISDYVWT